MKLVSRDWLALLARHQRAVGAGLVGIAVLAGIDAVQPSPGAVTEVVAAARTLSSGAVLTSEDLRMVPLPRALVPDAALRSVGEAVGLMAAGPVQRGEPLTSTRLVGARLVNQLKAGAVAVPVRIADAGSTFLVREGDHVDVLAAPPEGGAASVVAADAVVIATGVPESDSLSAGLDSGALLVLAVDRDVATRLASAAVVARLSLTLRGQ